MTNELTEKIPAWAVKGVAWLLGILSSAVVAAVLLIVDMKADIAVLKDRSGNYNTMTDQVNNHESRISQLEVINIQRGK